MKNRTIEEKIISRILKLEERVKKLEQKDSYYPQCEDEIRENYGGIDDIIIKKGENK